MSNSVKIEFLAAVHSILSGDTELLTATGINSQKSSARAVAVYNQVQQNAPVPYVRITLTDSITLQDEPYDYGQPTVQMISLLVDTFSDYEKECFAITDRLEFLLNNKPITTTHFTGSTWHKGTTFLTENYANPDRVLRHGSMRVRANLEPLP